MDDDIRSTADAGVQHNDTRAPLWDPETGCFDGPRVRMAIVGRGWTLQEFAALARVNQSTIYAAVRGRPVHDRTAIRVFQALATRQRIRIAS